MSCSKKLAFRLRRSNRDRKKVGGGTSFCPRMCIYRSNRAIYVQIIDDTTGNTLVSASSLGIGDTCNIGVATKVGKDIAEKAKLKGISKVVFDKNGFKYHGCLASLANASREGGLNF